MTVFKLIHIHDIDDYATSDVKDLGFFSSAEKAVEAISLFLPLAGFRDYPNGFLISRHDVSFSRKVKDPFVHEVVFSFHDKNWDYEYENVLGIYSTKSDALIAKKEFIELNKRPHAIYSAKLVKQVWINSRKLDEPNRFWAEGFL